MPIRKHNWKILLNVRFLIFLLALFVLFFTGSNRYIQYLNSQFLKISVKAISPPRVDSNVAIITLPPQNEASRNDPQQLAGFLNKIGHRHPAVTAVILDIYPSSSNYHAMKQIEESLREIMSQADIKRRQDTDKLIEIINELYKHKIDPAGIMLKNDIIIGIKPMGRNNSVFLSSNPGDFMLCQSLKYLNSKQKNFLNRLPDTALPPGMPVIYPIASSDITPAAPNPAVPVCYSNSISFRRPLVCRFNSHYLPTITASLFTAFTGNKDTVWLDKESVTFGFQQIKTDASGYIFPLFLLKGELTPNIKKYAFSDISSENDLKFLNKSIVLIGLDTDNLLEDSALTLLSLIANFTAYSPFWGIWLEKGIIILFFLYIVFMLPRVKSETAFVLSAFFIFALVTCQTGALLTRMEWIPLGGAMVFLVIGHVLMSIGFHEENIRRSLRKNAIDAFLLLSTDLFEHGKFEQAYRALRQAEPCDEVLSLIFKIGVEYERRRQYGKASDVFGYICKHNKSYKDSEKRYIRLIDLQDGKATGNTGADSSQTLNVPSFELQQSVIGRYEIERELGRGASGVVYLARDPKIGRHVAVKTLDFSLAVDGKLESVKDRFFSEAVTIGKLNHPNIVTVFDMGEEHGIAYIAMDYVPGKTLKYFTEQATLLPVRIVYLLMAQVAEALDYAHYRKIIHRDVKPGNIIYNESEKIAKVTDFGIARFMDTTRTRTGTILGSPAYMSPEQLKHSKVDGRADIFSLGVTFFHLLTGRFPFTGEDLASITYQITNVRHPEISSIRPDLPDSASRIINRALQKEPDKRYATAKNMAKSLKEGLKLLQ